jgi:hypothetical protein
MMNRVHLSPLKTRSGNLYGRDLSRPFEITELFLLAVSTSGAKIVESDAAFYIPAIATSSEVYPPPTT